MPDQIAAIELVGIAKHFRVPSRRRRRGRAGRLVIGEGEFFSLLGPSGCGKTTTLRMIGGFEEPTEGQILLYGKDVVGVPPNHRDVNMVFQSYALFPHMSSSTTSRSACADRIGAKDEINQRVNEMLELVQLDGKSNRRPRELSGGQQQRVALARALVNRPRALLLDEPLAALDLKLRQAMQIELKRIQREVGITFVFVTHDQNEALTMSDRLVVMNAGRIEQLGSPREIYERPRTRFVAGFIGTSNLVTGTVSRIVDGDGGHRHVAGRAHHRLRSRRRSDGRAECRSDRPAGEDRDGSGTDAWSCCAIAAGSSRSSTSAPRPSTPCAPRTAQRCSSSYRTPQRPIQARARR